MNTNSEKKFSLIRTISLPQTPLISFPNLIKPTSAGFWTSKNCMRVKNISVPLFSKTMGNLRPTEPKKKCRIMTETLNNIVKDVQFDELPHKRRENSSKYFFSLPHKKCLTGVPHTELIKEIIAYNKDPNKGSGNELRANIHLNKEEIDNLYKNKKKPEIRFKPARHNKKLFEIRRPVTEGGEKIYEGLEMAMLKFINRSKFKLEIKNEKQLVEIKEKDSFKSIIQEIKSEKNLNYIDNNVKKTSFDEKTLDIDTEIFNTDFGTGNKYFKVQCLHKKVTIKDVLQKTMLQKRQSMLNSIPTLQTPNTKNKPNEKIIEEDVYHSDEEDDKLENDPALKNETNLNEKQFRDLVNEAGPVKKIKKSTKLLRKALKEALFFISSLKLNLTELQEQKIFSNKPFEKEGSYDFINACKLGDKMKALEKLLGCKYLVYDFDYVYLTALHWVSKRGHFNIAEMLISFGAHLDAKDLIGRTPLYLALKHNHLAIAKILLYNKANPWSTKNLDYNKMVLGNPSAKSLLSKARKLHILMKMTPADQRKAIWEKDAWLLTTEKEKH